MKHIDVYLESLRESFGAPRSKAESMMLEIEHKVDNISAMVRIIACSMFPLGTPRIVIGHVKSGGPKKAAAWLQLIEPMHPYGTQAFQAMRVQLCIRNTFMRDAPFQTISFAIAHELAHLILFSIGKTNHDEKYVDLIAMYFGFAELYVQGQQFYPQREKEYGDSIRNDNLRGLLHLCTMSKIGYLSVEEAHYASKIIKLWRQ